SRAALSSEALIWSCMRESVARRSGRVNDYPRLLTLGRCLSVGLEARRGRGREPERDEDRGSEKGESEERRPARSRRAARETLGDEGDERSRGEERRRGGEGH